MAVDLKVATRYVHGWCIWAWALKKALTKKHGAGPQKFVHALKGAACARWIVDGQGRGGSGPRWLVKVLHDHRG